MSQARLITLGHLQWHCGNPYHDPGIIGVELRDRVSRIQWNVIGSSGIPLWSYIFLATPRVSTTLIP